MNFAIFSTLPILSADVISWVSLLCYGIFAVLFLSKLRREKKTVITLMVRRLIGMAVTVGLDIVIHAIMRPFPVEQFANVDGVTMTDSSFIFINRKKIVEFKRAFLKHQKIFDSNIVI